MADFNPRGTVCKIAFILFKNFAYKHFSCARGNNRFVWLPEVGLNYSLKLVCIGSFTKHIKEKLNPICIITFFKEIVFSSRSLER